MKTRSARVGVMVLALIGLIALIARPLVIPREPVPEGWALDVHQPGEWWNQPVIPRSVVVQRCPPPAFWSSDPDLSVLTGLKPGSSVEYSFFTDDYHCAIGWSQPEAPVTVSGADLATEAGLRRYCSASGLPVDDRWRYLGRRAQQAVGNTWSHDPMDNATVVQTAGFVDAGGTVLSCLVNTSLDQPGAGVIELALGGAGRATATPSCPVSARELARSDAGTAEEYRLRGAGPVRGADGRVLTDAATLVIGLTGDTVTSTHPVIDGVAIVDAGAAPATPITFDWNRLPEVTGKVYAADGTLLATCRA
jgi:hypothetical protein